MLRNLSIIPALVIGGAVLLTHPGTPALAESYPSDRPSEPARTGAASKVKTKSKETWADMKARWAKQRERWADCQRREKMEKRTGKATRAFLEECMTRP